MVVFAILGTLLVLVAVACIAVPLGAFRARPATTTSAGLVIAAALCALYMRESQWLAQAATSVTAVPALTQRQSAQPRTKADAMVVALKERAAASPEDIQSLLMLGQAYLASGRPDEALAPLQRAESLGKGGDVDVLLTLGVAHARRAGGTMTSESAALFERAFALAPSNPQVLLLSGLAAERRGARFVARSRWRQLRAMNPDPDLAAQLDKRLAALDRSLASQR